MIDGGIVAFFGAIAAALAAVVVAYQLIEDL